VPQLLQIVVVVVVLLLLPFPPPPHRWRLTMLPHLLLVLIPVRDLGNYIRRLFACVRFLLRSDLLL
jgi:hypothetical protein